MKQAIILHTLILTTHLALVTSSKAKENSCPLVKIETDRLSDLNIARCGHAILNVQGELTVFGGHTTNFIPTSTAEYFKEGKWYVVPMAFPHDNGLALPLSSGKVLVAGGHEKEMGIGQSWSAEWYDPTTHTFEASASLGKKRALATALEIDSGRVVIAGNWFANDSIEIFDGNHTFKLIKGVSTNRSLPYILRSAKDEAIIFGHVDNKGKNIDNIMIDCLHGSSYYHPLLKEWKALSTDIPIDNSVSFIGNEQRDDYSYLLSMTNANDSLAIVLVRNGEFSLLPTTSSIPTTSKWGKISYYPHILADRQRQKAYLIGYGEMETKKPKSTRLFVLTIDYRKMPAHLSLGYTEPLTDIDIRCSALTNDGNLVLVGGLFSNNNFKPSASTWILYMGENASAGDMLSYQSYLWYGVLLSLLALIAAVCIWMRKRQAKKGESAILAESMESEFPGTHSETAIDTELMQHISQLMEAERLYLNPDLRLSDLADRIGIHRNYISKCINKQKGCSFSYFVATYRIEHAKQLMLSNRDITMQTVSLESGFANEKSFYRTFRQLTAKSPKDWLENQD